MKVYIFLAKQVIFQEVAAVVDIHCHILPDTDDGAGSPVDSVEMARIAADSGIRSIVATPHCNIPGICRNYRSDSLISKLSALQAMLELESIPVTLHPGQEIFFTDDFEEHLKRGDFITLNNSRYMLIEFDFGIPENEAVRSVNLISSLGIVPVVAHPERYGFVISQPDSIHRLSRAGGLIQLNRSSIVGEFGSRIYVTSKYILSNGLADFVASDAHSQYSRTPDFSDVHEAISEISSYDYADLLLDINPSKIIRNETV